MCNIFSFLFSCWIVLSRFPGLFHCVLYDSSHKRMGKEHWYEMIRNYAQVNHLSLNYFPLGWHWCLSCRVSCYPADVTICVTFFYFLILHCSLFYCLLYDHRLEKRSNKERTNFTCTKVASYDSVGLVLSLLCLLFNFISIHVYVNYRRGFGEDGSLVR